MRPRSILLIMADDHAAHALGALGNPIVQTPSLDMLAAEGALFASHFCQAPMCTPARQSLLTSRMPHHVGVPFLTSAMPPGTHTLATHARDHGFRTIAIGKTHFNGGDRHGFEHIVDRKDYQQLLAHDGVSLHDAFPGGRPWRPFEEPARDWLNTTAEATPLTYERSEAHFLASRASEWFRTAGTDPFFMMLSFYEPHSPFVFPCDAIHRYNPTGIAPPRLTTKERHHGPEIFRDLTEADVRGITAAYYASVSHLDRAIGEALTGLHDAGLEDNTIVAYCPDHGYMLGHHARFEKHCMYDEALRVPFIVRSPGQVSAGAVIHDLSRSIDVAPTLCDLAGLAPMPDACGVPLPGTTQPPMESGKHQPGHVSAEYFHTETAMIRTNGQKLVVSTGEALDWYHPSPDVNLPQLELYDLIEDPDEHNPIRLQDTDASALTHLLDPLAGDLGISAEGAGPELLSRIRSLLRSCRTSRST
jgi:choline-sulfatase